MGVNTTSIDLVPTNRSLQFLRPVWKECAIGAMRYMLRHPIAGPRVLAARLHFPMRKTPLPKPVRTPEGFELRTNLEVHLYTNLFVERALYHAPLMKSFRRAVNPVVLDVGACLGMVPQWFGMYNSTAVFHCFEPSDMIHRARELAQQRCITGPRIQFNRLALSDTIGTATLFQGHASSLVPQGLDCQETKVWTTTVDQYLTEQPVNEIFLLKIDTDGSNASVLRGASETLNHTRWVLIEKEGGIMEHLKGFTVVSESIEDLLLKNTYALEDRRDDYLWNR